MNASDVVKQLWKVVPTITDLFTDNVGIVSITSSGTTATVTTSSDHNLENGDIAIIVGALAPNPITELTQIGNVASVTTTVPHDVTEGFKGTIIDPIVVEGSTESDYNGSHDLIAVENRFKFEYQISGDPVSPATGSPILFENLKFGYNGTFNVIVTGVTTFTYELPQALISPAGGTISCKVRPRISALVSLERAQKVYTKQGFNEIWAFVVLGSRTANNDRTTNTDAINTLANGSDYRQFILQPLSIYLFIPASTEIGAATARDLANDLAVPFSSALLRTKFQSQFSSQPYSGIVFESDAFAAYNGALYVHEYVFQSSEYITYPDTMEPDFGVPFREIDITYLSYFNGEEIMTDKIPLDCTRTDNLFLGNVETDEGADVLTDEDELVLLE